MDRRTFLNISLPAAGAALVAPGMLSKQALAEIGRQFSGNPDFDTYDVVINGAGFSGYFAAMHAARQGKRVLVVERRTSPGFEVAAQKRCWLGAQGFEALDPELKTLLLPEGELPEVQRAGGDGPNNSRFGGEVLLFAGSIRKGLLRNLLLQKVDVLLMTDVCGLLAGGGQVQGVLLAGKLGLHTVRCRNFIDASNQLLFSRYLLDKPSRVTRAEFVLELLGAKDPAEWELQVGSEYGIEGNTVRLHPGKRSGDQVFLAFSFTADSPEPADVEQQARLISGKLGRGLHQLDASLADAHIHQLALECTLSLEDEQAPVPLLKGHHLLAGGPPDLTCQEIQRLDRAVRKSVDSLAFGQSSVPPDSLVTPGSEIPFANVVLEDVEEPGLRVPLKRCRFDPSAVSREESCQVLVAGGGTAGALAGLGAAEKGANTLVVDYFNDLGGTKTMGSVMGYYHGVKEHAFFKKHVDEAERLSADVHMNKQSGRKFYHLQSLLDQGGRFLGDAIICGALTENKQVQGILVSRPGRLEAIRSQVCIDSTGDADVAYFAGADYQIGDDRMGMTQNYSQWDISGVPDKPSHHGRDYDIIDNTRIAELQRGLFISHYEAHFYDFSPMLAVREARRIKGLYTLNLIDAVEGRHFEDVVSMASSDFDPHNMGSSEYTKCGFLLPHSNVLTTEIPYRCLVPEGLDGLLVSGRGFSQSHNAFQFTRMTADLIVLGYLCGQIAADQAWSGTGAGDYKVSDLQQEWIALGYLPAEDARPVLGQGIDGQKPFAGQQPAGSPVMAGGHGVGDSSPAGERAGLTGKPWENSGEIARRITALNSGKSEYLYECARLPKEKALPELREAFESSPGGEGRLLLAKALAWFGEPAGNALITAELETMFEQESAEGYPGGYVDDYDSIRGREKNRLEGLFWRINQNIGLLAMSGSPEGNVLVARILEHTESGGPFIDRQDDYFNGRIDLRFVPFYNRILNLCFYAERMADPLFAPGFEQLLRDEHIAGYKASEYEEVRWKVFGGRLEHAIAAALARCGGRRGYELLADYLTDVHFRFKKFAAAELRKLTGRDHGFDAGAWQRELAGLSFPRPARKLAKPDVEV